MNNRSGTRLTFPVGPGFLMLQVKTRGRWFQLKLSYLDLSGSLTQKEYDSLSNTGSLDPHCIRFSQNTVRIHFQNVKSTFPSGVLEVARDLLKGMVKAGSIKSIKIVLKDNKTYTLDNRRLLAFKIAGKEVPYEKCDLNALSEYEKRAAYRKFTTRNEGTMIDVLGL